jgi:hypothetical protein
MRLSRFKERRVLSCDVCNWHVWNPLARWMRVLMLGGVDTPAPLLGVPPASVTAIHRWDRGM